MPTLLAYRLPTQIDYTPIGAVNEDPSNFFEYFFPVLNISNYRGFSIPHIKEQQNMKVSEIVTSHNEHVEDIFAEPSFNLCRVFRSRSNKQKRINAIVSELTDKGIEQNGITEQQAKLYSNLLERLDMHFTPWHLQQLSTPQTTSVYDSIRAPVAFWQQLG